MNLWEVQGWLYDSLFVLVPHRQLVEETALGLDQVEGAVLDAGCGTGRLSEWSRAKIVGVDFSQTMLRRARQRSSCVRRVDLSQPLPFKDGQFQAVVSLNVLYTLPSPASTVKELARVLAPGGQLILATPVSSRLSPLVREHLKTASARQLLVSLVNLPRLIAWVVNLGIRGLFEHHHFTFLKHVELLGMVEAAGLRVLSAEPCYAGIDLKIIARKELA
jgi:ubiquinone/menaquinone biosynthesis C-methylase UbiE